MLCVMIVCECVYVCGWECVCVFLALSHHIHSRFVLSMKLKMLGIISDLLFKHLASKNGGNGLHFGGSAGLGIGGGANGGSQGKIVIQGRM